MKHQLTKYLLFVLLLKTISGLTGVWRWECEEGYCQKKEITPDTQDTAISLSACRLLCSDASALWPKPTGEIHVGTTLVKVNPNSISHSGVGSEKRSHSLIGGAMTRFNKQLNELRPKTKRADGGKTLEITYILSDPGLTDLTLETEEGYALTVVETSDGRLNATIVADNFYGGRNGLETLNQLIVYDDLREELIMPNDISITDKPAYPWRGLALDTSRNYITVDAIKNTLSAMASSKLNSFHWHITDSHSFPFTADSLPDLRKYGAYTPKKIYTPEDVADIVAHGKECGVRVVPEFDAPAHVGEGWQNTDYVVCFKAAPWQDYCVEPPCGQFDPTKDGLYDALESLYGDMIKQFQPTIFHMGGDEVHFGCWNSTASIVEWMQNQGWGRSEEDFIKLWDHFQTEALKRLYKQTSSNIPVILWTSTLTEGEYLEHLSKDQYIIQIWTTGSDPQISNLLANGYRVIISNYDALYLDCGFSGWVTDGNNWCSPYKGWQKIYENKPATVAGGKNDLVLGMEAALWTEQVDSASVDTRLWPRAAAMGEVLWSEPSNGWREAESRMLVQRERIINLGVNADALEPEWCRQYEESCPTNGKHNGGEYTPTTLMPPTTGSATKILGGHPTSVTVIFLLTVTAVLFIS
ncbi:chitooligosaccharidolytic beta-N-acetylglucosaminidase isoform X2 [Zophobas morio]|uniref:chitooligosaccharidolytic beta-N-acetylglucosaminidase isoform X2 n=1 Tax=Zophobas morio TaxID=2755281 RepID=UPI003083C269